ncbi:DNA methylase [Candidatus Saccharibacteria bacterium]|nr:DNA methylase [Candidatus Saccharibacteria bacterium]
MGKVYIAIDLKSFYASVECVERGLDPLRARLVVADFSRTEKTICLAVSPALKAFGLSGRERLYEVLRVARANKVDFVAAPPRMRKYMEVSRKIFGIYASFVSPNDIHVYSIDEVFIDATDYVKLYNVTAHELAERMIHKVLDETGITATAGIGTNMYLAKVAMDIVAKHIPADKHGVRIAELDEISYRQKLWEHTPITDFWRVGRGYARRLKNLGIYTMGDLANYSLTGYEKLYKVFGVNAELLIDHAWGWEPVTMPDIKNYSSDNHSVSSGQVLSRPYDYDEARLVTWEMADALALDLFAKNIVTDKIVLTINYDKDVTNYDGPMQVDFYGRTVPKCAHGTINLDGYTNLSKIFAGKALELYDEIVNPDLRVRAIYVVAAEVKNDDGNDKLRQLDFFTNYAKQNEERRKEKRLQRATLEIKKKYGKNSLLKAANYEESATMRMRNSQVGGHKA